jgi:hypothetical protein
MLCFSECNEEFCEVNNTRNNLKLVGKIKGSTTDFEYLEERVVF